MADPYRDPEHACPACKQTLREYQGRLLCDGCEGMMVSLADLVTAIHDLTSLEPTFEYKDEAPGQRPCPRCLSPMTTCKLRVVLDGAAEHPRPELDRCAVHGIWFDSEELAKVFEKVAGKGFGGGAGRKESYAGPGNRGRWSAVFPFWNM